MRIGANVPDFSDVTFFVPRLRNNFPSIRGALTLLAVYEQSFEIPQTLNGRCVDAAASHLHLHGEARAAWSFALPGTQRARQAAMFALFPLLCSVHLLSATAAPWNIKGVCFRADHLKSSTTNNQRSSGLLFTNLSSP
jgi:hypothetical protein